MKPSQVRPGRMRQGLPFCELLPPRDSGVDYIAHAFHFLGKFDGPHNFPRSQRLSVESKIKNNSIRMERNQQ